MENGAVPGYRGGHFAEGEDIELLALGIDKSLAMIVSSGIRHAKTIVLLQCNALHLFNHPAS